LFLAKIKLMLTSIIIIVIAKKEIKNSKKGIIYTILITSKYKILLKSKGLQGIYLIILSFA